MRTWQEFRDACLRYEDRAVLVLDKPAGISVAGERHGVDLVTLAREAGESLIPAHRLDKVTSGLVVLARDEQTHAQLAVQFERRTVTKTYLAVTVRAPTEPDGQSTEPATAGPGGPAPNRTAPTTDPGAPAPGTAALPDRGVVDLPLGAGRKNRVRVAADRSRILRDADRGRWSVAPGDVFTHIRVQPARTGFTTVWQDNSGALLVVTPVTGRRHQIRVHLAWIGHPIAGDPLFGRPAFSGTAGRGDGHVDGGTGAASGRDRPAGLAGEEDVPSVPRTLLHAWRLAFDAPWAAGDGVPSRVELTAHPGPDFWEGLSDRLRPEDALARCGRALR